MAGQMSPRGAELALDASTGRASTTSRSMYLALLTAAPDDTTDMSTMTEATFTYTRPLIELDAATGTPRTISNTNNETIGPLDDADGTQTVSHWALVSAQTGTTGELTWYGSWATSRTPQSGDSLEIAAGDLDLSVD